MTMQAHEIIEYRGENYSMFGLPLDSYIKNNKLELIAPSSANWRGYQGYWKLENEELFITDIETANVTYEDIFKTKLPIKAEWFSGTINIGLGEPIYDRFNVIFDNYLWLQIQNGLVVEKRISRNIISDFKMKFGKYKGKSILEILKGKINTTFNTNVLLYEYVSEVVNFLHVKDYNNNIMIPFINISDEIKELIFEVRNHPFKSLLTKNFFAIEKHFYVNIPDNELENTEKFSNLLELILTSNFSNVGVLKKKGCNDCMTSDKTLLINPDHDYLKWAILNVPQFYVPPHLLNIENLKYLKSFTINRLNSTIFEYSPNIVSFNMNFSIEVLELNKAKFEKNNGVYYDKSLQNYFYDLSIAGNFKRFGYFLDENYFEEEEDDNNYEDDDDRRSYSEYNGAYGFDDDTINSAFDGDPENYWNID